MNNSAATNTLTPSAMLSWAFGLLVFITGILNLVLVHPVPGVAYLLVSLGYLPPVNAALKRRFGFAIPGVVKVVLGLMLIQFTLGVSDLGNMID